MVEIEIRPWTTSDSADEITEMLHRAYGDLARRNLHFNASHQPPAQTLERLTSGTSFVAIHNGRIVGCISLYESRPISYHPYYQREKLVYFGQFGVEPSLRGQGIGLALYKTVEQQARLMGAIEIALDTAEPASELIDMYKKWGFDIVDHADWNSTNYKSVIMAKAL